MMPAAASHFALRSQRRNQLTTDHVTICSVLGVFNCLRELPQHVAHRRIFLKRLELEI